MDEQTYQAIVRRLVKAEVRKGRRSLVAVLRACEGAHPETVKPILDDLLADESDPQIPTSTDAPPMVASLLGHGFRARMAELFCALPAPNPELAQWWFDIDSVEYLTLEVERLADMNTTVLCIGAPTVAFALAMRDISTILLDNDFDVLVAVQALLSKLENGRLTCREFRAGRDRIGEFVQTPVSIALVDPPWYMKNFGQFLECGVSVLAPGGSLFTTLPPRLTRPRAELERADVVEAIQRAGLRVLAVERARLGYIVPRFEKSTYGALPQFTGLPWRRGDLAHARAADAKLASSALITLAGDDFILPNFKTYSRSPAQFRVFAATVFAEPRVANSAASHLWCEPNYSATVSSRGRAEGLPLIWTSEKIGIWANTEYTLETARQALEAWQKGQSKDETIDQVNTRQYGKEVADALDEFLDLWGRFERVDKSTCQLDTAKLHDGDFEREHGAADDRYRSPFFRDRDRIVWSDGLRKLANKTQVFPASRDDQLRQRLAHSLEVVQLATTIGHALSLDLQLIEAGGLAHDIGHTPFGHAGEHALHYVMARVNPALFFNHYEHGVDIVRYLEAPYQLHPGHPGLNLTRGTIDCIFKHVYLHENATSGGTHCGGTGVRGVPKAPNSLAELHRRSKHSAYLTPGYCHAEGQAVRLADKISYLLSDIEDGIRLGAISFEDIRSCCLFLRPPIDFVSRSGESLEAVFIRERRNILRVLMEDAIDTSSRLLRQDQRQGREPGRTIDHSSTVQQDVGEVWRRLQAGRLHRFPAVRQSNLHATKVVSELFVAFSLMPDLIDSRFREAHINLTQNNAGRQYLAFYDNTSKEVTIPEQLRSFIPLERTIGEVTARVEEGKVNMRNFILAKDYVASLSDGHAEDLHTRILA